MDVVNPRFLDSSGYPQYWDANFDQAKLLTADRDPQRYKEFPEASTRQRQAPSGVFGVWFGEAHIPLT